MKLIILLCALMVPTVSAGDTLIVQNAVTEHRAVSGLDGECPIGVNDGWHHLILTSHYRHVYPTGGVITWSSTEGIWIDGPGIAQAVSEGRPMGHEWVMDMMLAGECGTIPAPNMIFSDGFEAGNTRAWE